MNALLRRALGLFHKNDPVALPVRPIAQDTSDPRVPAGVLVPDLISLQLAARGIKQKYASEFLRAWRAGKWSHRMHADFWGPQTAQMNPASVLTGPISNVIPQSAQFMPDFAAFATELNKVNEIVRWGLYDRVVYTTAGAQTLTFFQNSLNAGFQVTNMLQAGALPGNQSQLVAGIRVGLEPAAADIAAGIAFQDWSHVAIGFNWMELTVSTKNYMRESPIAKMAPGYGLIGSPGFVFSAGAGTMPAFLQVGSPDRQACYDLKIPLAILPTRTFSVTLNWIPTVPLSSAANDGSIVVELDGLMLRAAQ